MKILVAHRQKEVADQVYKILQYTNPYVRFFTSGLDALMLAKREEFDLIVCGTDLPVVTGFGLVLETIINLIRFCFLFSLN